MALRLASKETTRIDLGDEAFVEVLNEVSKGDFNRLIASMPSDITEGQEGFTPSQGTQFQSALFEVLVKGWSLDAPATVENYLGLVRDDAAKIDDALVNHFASLTPDAPKERGRKRS